MNLDDYQAEALSVAIYDHGDKLFYPALALAGEAGEVADQMKKLYRDDSGKLTPSRQKKLKLELGDTLFYLALTATSLGLSLQDLALRNLKKCRSRNKKKESRA